MGKKHTEPAAKRRKNSRGIKVRVGEKTRILPFAKAFSYGHTLLMGQHYEQALQMFRALGQVFPNDGRIKVMLARCQIGLDHYGASRELLEQAFADTDEKLAGELHAAFVYKRLGMTDDAIREVERIVKGHGGFPTGCLVLGDMFAAEGRHKQAITCWKQAIKRDAPQGTVAQTAIRQIERLKEARKRATKSKQKPRGRSARKRRNKS
ncbi:MAG: tetratricopeptide repeat protein [Planctomycetota bacterium]